jgi:hypothetical protein
VPDALGLPVPLYLSCVSGASTSFAENMEGIVARADFVYGRERGASNERTGLRDPVWLRGGEA